MTIVGVDLGGTKIQVVAVDGGDVVADSKVATPDGGGTAIADAIAGAIAEMEVDRIEAIGVGAPGVIDRDACTVLKAPNLSIESSVPLGRLVAEAAGVPPAAVRLDNDVNVATVAEHRRGAAVGVDDALCVFVGTGVGGGLVLGGALHRGAHGLAGEIGHAIVHEGGRRCGCGGAGHLEAYAGRRSLEEEARRRHEAGEPTKLVELAGEKRMKSSVFRKALEAGDEVARDLLDGAAAALGAALASVIAVVDVELVVMGGGLADKLAEPFRQQVDDELRHRLFVTTMPVRLVPSALGDLGGALGAALLWE